MFRHLKIVSQAKIGQIPQIMRAFLHILVLVAFLGGIIAPACGFLWGGNFSVIEICTTNGIENRIVADNQDSNDTAPNHQKTDNCQFCFTQAHLASQLVPVIIFESVFFQNEKLRFEQYEENYLLHLHNDYAARAPPTFV
jgi:hypothetical protein